MASTGACGGTRERSAQGCRGLPALGGHHDGALKTFPGTTAVLPTNTVACSVSSSNTIIGNFDVQTP